MRSMPLYRQMSSSTVAYRDLIQDQDTQPHEINQNNNNNNNVDAPKPILRRTKSERSEHVVLDDISLGKSSIVAIPSKTKGNDHEKESSILSISFEPPIQMMNKKGKASSVINGAELINEKESKKGKPISVLSDSMMSKGPFIQNKLKLIELEMGPKDEKGPGSDPPTTKEMDEQPVTKPIKKIYGNEYGGLFAESEIGPSASVVAAALAEKGYPLDDKRSSVLDGWSVDESTEGLRSKLERWRTELPQVHNRGTASSSYHSTGPHRRRRSNRGSSLFSCFGNICGYECQCICGKPKRKTVYTSPSTASRSCF